MNFYEFITTLPPQTDGDLIKFSEIIEKLKRFTDSDPRIVAKKVYLKLDEGATYGFQKAFMVYSQISKNELNNSYKDTAKLLDAVNSILELQNNDPKYAVIHHSEVEEEIDYASYPGGQIHIAPIPVPHKNGQAYMFLAVDAFSHFIFPLQVEEDISDDTFVKKIQELIETKEFKVHSKPFKLVIPYATKKTVEEMYELILPLNGKLIVDPELTMSQIDPVLDSMEQYFKN